MPDAALAIACECIFQRDNVRVLISHSHLSAAERVENSQFSVEKIRVTLHIRYRVNGNTLPNAAGSFDMVPNYAGWDQYLDTLTREPLVGPMESFVASLCRFAAEQLFALAGCRVDAVEVHLERSLEGGRSVFIRQHLVRGDFSSARGRPQSA